MPFINDPKSLALLGGAAALLAALLWSAAAVIFRKLGENIPPTELNLVKGSLAVTMMIVTTLLLGEKSPNTSTFTLILLALSGIIGIGLGDTAYFESLNKLGTRLALLMGVLSPPMAGLISWGFLGEKLLAISWLGIMITLVGVSWVIMQEQSDHPVKRQMWIGLIFAFIASLSQSIGAVISRYALTSSDISALQTAIIRLLAGIGSLLIVIAFQKGKRFAWLNKSDAVNPTPRKLLGMIALVGFIGTYLAIWLQQVALQLAPAGITQTLLSTSPIFILPIAALRGEKVSWKAVLGVIISLAGVVLLFSVS